MEEAKLVRRAQRYASDAQRLHESGKYENSEEYFWKSLRILEPLAQEKPKQFGAIYATVYYKYAVSRGGDIGRFRKAYYLALEHPDDLLCKQIIEQLSKFFGS